MTIEPNFNRDTVQKNGNDNSDLLYCKGLQIDLDYIPVAASFSMIWYVLGVTSW